MLYFYESFIYAKTAMCTKLAKHQWLLCLLILFARLLVLLHLHVCVFFFCFCYLCACWVLILRFFCVFVLVFGCDTVIFCQKKNKIKKEWNLGFLNDKSDVKRAFAVIKKQLSIFGTFRWPLFLFFFVCLLSRFLVIFFWQIESTLFFWFFRIFVRYELTRKLQRYKHNFACHIFFCFKKVCEKQKS